MPEKLDIVYSDNKALASLERSAVNTALNRHEEDSDLNMRDMELDLFKCYTLNGYAYSLVGLLGGSLLSLSYRTLKPLAFAAVVCPLLDIYNEKSQCAELQSTYGEMKKKARIDKERLANNAILKVRETYMQSIERD
uniref:Uncharacterized protein n=1 Tax=Polytomella parva TaxID=51329 RepID=A0A7S0VA43_9CHLO|mmetsp:Transcript_28835/g.52967  ORF Transcript_28835/g.52967 Transcript_28835/m.52967 type:complete len:137 (+) Transcript_28835:44-454(+)